MKEKWSSRGAFILASIGSAVGLGNAWRFPGMCAKYGGGAFLIAYILCMVVLALPVLMSEIAIGRKTGASAPKAFRLMNKKGEAIGWCGVASSLAILCYYAVVFAWCIIMCILSFRFATDASDAASASQVWSQAVGYADTTSLSGEGGDIKILLVVCLITAWMLMYSCIRKGASRVSKVVKFTVFIPIVMLIILAVKGFINNPHLGEALSALFIPKWRAFGNAELWIGAMCQAFYSLGIMFCVMITYGSYLKGHNNNIVTDSFIIAFSDLGVSILSGIVLFTTMYQSGYTVDNMTISGVQTAFFIYPQAIVGLSPYPVLNAIFGFIFYFMLCTLAIDSAFSELESSSHALSEKLKIPKNKMTLFLTIVCLIISIIFITGAGPNFVDITDYFMNQVGLLFVGGAEVIFIGWIFKPDRVLDEINKNTKKFKMSKWFYFLTIKFIIPISILTLIVFQIIGFVNTGFRYNPEYLLAVEIVFGWLVVFVVFTSWLMMKIYTKYSKRGRKIKSLEEDEPSWDEIDQEVTNPE